MGPEKSNEVNQPNDTEIPSNNENEIAEAVAVPSNNEQTAKIVKLDIDSFQEASDYWPLKDMISVGETCKQLHQAVGYLLRHHYSGAEILCASRNDLRIGNMDRVLCSEKFMEFAQKVSIYMDEGLQHFSEIQSQFRRLKHIELQHVSITRHKVQRLTNILAKVETLHIHRSMFSGHFYETLIAFCPNIKRLSMIGCSDESDFLNEQIDVLHKALPTLQYFQFELSNEYQLAQIKIFLQLNPNIQKLALSMCGFSRFASIERTLMAVDNKLHELSILTNLNAMELGQVLKKLHERGFYQRLQLYLHRSDIMQHQIDQMATLDGLVKLSLDRGTIRYSVTISALKCLEELSAYECDRISDLEEAAVSLTQLERIYFKFASLNRIWPFIRLSGKVNKIKVNHLMDGINFNSTNNVINLMALNREREKLRPKVRKLTIFVRENIYLATKWAMGTTDCSLIRLSRIDAYEWDHDFEW